MKFRHYIKIIFIVIMNLSNFDFIKSSSILLLYFKFLAEKPFNSDKFNSNINKLNKSV